jgi:hypothetical protein
MTGDLLNAQEGGRMVYLKENTAAPSLPGPTITQTGIKMKIKLVNDDTTLPSYLVSKLTCGDGNGTPAELTPSTIVVTLSGENLQKLNKTNATQINNFKCEMISDFLTQGEKSAITIETYYLDTSTSSSPTDPPKVNTIYFDDSLLSSYDSATPPKIKKSTNPFLINATTDDKGSYTFTFDFDTIIGLIQKLESYKQIQNMFRFVNNIADPTDLSNKITATTLIKISENAYLNLNFSGVPFATITKKPGPNLTITTTQPEIASVTACDLSLYFGSDASCKKITETLKPVLSLPSPGYNFDCTTLYSTPPPINPATQSPPPPAQQPQPGLAGPASDATQTARAAVNISIGNVGKSLSDPSIQADVEKLPPSVKEFTNAINLANTIKKTNAPAAHAALEAVMRGNPTLQQDIDRELAKNPTGPMNALLTDVKNIHSTIPAAMGPAAMVPATAVTAPPAEQLTAAQKFKIGVTDSALATSAAARQAFGAVVKGVSTLINADGLSASACSTGDIAMKCDGANNVMTLEVPYQMIINTCFQGNMQAALASGVLNSQLEPANGGGEGDAAKKEAAAAAAAKQQAAAVAAKQQAAAVAAKQQAEAAAKQQAAAQAILDNLNASKASADKIALAQASLQKATALAAQAASAAQAVSAAPAVTTTDASIFITTGSDILKEIERANADFKALQQLVSDKKLNTSNIPSFDLAKKAVDDANAAKDAIVAKATANAASKLSQVSLASEADSAKQKISQATSAVAEAKKDIDAAVLKKASELDPAKKIELSTAETKLTAEKAALDAAKGNLDKIFPPPDNLSDLNKLHTDATAAIPLATASLVEANKLVSETNSAADNAKAAAVQAATSKIGEAVGLVANVTTAVKALVDGVGEAEKLKPTKDSVTKRAKELIGLTTEAGSKIDGLLKQSAAKQGWLKWGFGGIVSGISAVASKVTSNSAENAFIANLRKTSMTKYLSKLNTDLLQKPNIVIGEVNETTGDIIFKVRDIFTYYETKYSFLPKFPTSASPPASASAPASEPDENTLKEINVSLYILTQIMKVIDKVINILTTLVSNPNTDVTTDVGIAVKELTDVNKSELIEKLQNVSIDQAGGSNTDDESFDSHSNSHSANNKTKNKNNSKSKSKNKTKKNHSKSKSNKSKTPKIIMNE